MLRRGFKAEANDIAREVREELVQFDDHEIYLQQREGEKCLILPCL
jgi:hypothetical protein